MELLERAVYFGIGGGVGFILGFIVARLREIKEELDDVDECVKRCREDHEHIPRKPRDETGSFRLPSWQTFAVVFVVLMSAFASFVSQKSANDVKENQKDLAEVAFCNQQYLMAQAEFLRVYLGEPRPSDDVRAAALQEYLDILETYIEATDLEGSNMLSNNNVTAFELSECITQAKERQDE